MFRVNRISINKYVFGIIVLVFITAFCLILPQFVGIDFVKDSSHLQQKIEQFGAFGPIVIIFLMIIAIVISPLPSAPIAIAAGFLYGSLWGGIYCIIGAEIGAIVAFKIARYLGQEKIRSWLNDKIKFDLFDSQGSLMVAVFIARLIPYVSFDVVSYVSGLTSLKTWRFALATLLGMLPMTLLFTCLGDSLAINELKSIILVIIMLLIFTLMIIKFKRNFDTIK